MSDLPQHPDSSEPRGSRPRRSVGSYLVIVAAVLLIGAFLVLHLTGVLGPGQH
jgi:hypothetical protein